MKQMTKVGKAAKAPKQVTGLDAQFGPNAMTMDELHGKVKKMPVTKMAPSPKKKAASPRQKAQNIYQKAKKSGVKLP